MCYVLLVIQLLNMNGFFPLCYGFCSCLLWSTPCSIKFGWSEVLVADILCLGGFFPVCWEFFPVIHSCSFVYQSSMFRVVDVVCAVSYTYSCWGWMDFFPAVVDFFLCVMVYVHAVVWVIHGDTCRLPVYQRIFPVCGRFFFLSFTPGYSCISPVYSEYSWCGMCC